MAQRAGLRFWVWVTVPKDVPLPGHLPRPDWQIDLKESSRFHHNRWRLDSYGSFTQDTTSVNTWKLWFKGPSGASRYSIFNASSDPVCVGRNKVWLAWDEKEGGVWLERNQLKSLLNVPTHSHLKPPMAVIVWATQSRASHNISWIVLSFFVVVPHSDL